MEDKQLDFDAPLLSVRRFGPESESTRSPAVPAVGGGNPNAYPKRSALPFYKPDLKSGPVRNPGVVPFVWEQTPGRPKHVALLDRPSAAPKLPPGRMLIDKGPPANSNIATEEDKKSIEAEDVKEKRRPLISAECKDDDEDDNEREEEEEEKFADALETLSRTESFFMNCSVSGLSGVPEKAEVSGSFSTDPRVRDFMMGRFLPAAKAVATGTSHGFSSLRRLQPTQPREPVRVVERAENGDQRRAWFPMNYQHGQEGVGTSCSYDEDDDEEDDEEDGYDNGHFSSKACGLIPKFCLLNPLPGMKLFNSRLPPTSVRRVRGLQVKAVQRGSLGQAEEEYSWEAVYKHKLMHGNPTPQGEDVSKLTSESNQLTYSGDSLTADGSSPQHRSNIGGISPYRNEPSQSPFQEGKGFLGVPRRDRKGSKTDGSDSFEKDEDYWVVTPHHSSKCESGSMSPTVESMLPVDVAHRPETTMSKSTSIGTSSDNKDITRSADEDFEAGVESRRTDECLVLETRDQVALQAKVTYIVETGPTVCEETSACGVINEDYGFKPSDNEDSPLCSKDEIEMKKVVADPTMTLLPPPLPSSPSESWLSRTLPSVSSKNPSAQSFLGIHVHPRKQTSNSSPTPPKKEIPVKAFRVLRGQTRFADMLAKPLSPQSEI